MTVAGQKSIVDSVSLLQVSRLVNISGATQTVTATIDLARPLNLQWMSATSVQVTVVIQPKQKTVRTVDVPVSLTGVPAQWTAEMSQEAAVVRITGRQDLVDAFPAEQLTLTCDVSGLSAGMYEVPLQYAVPDGSAHELLIEIEPETLQVTLTAPAE